jgi:hypothetical protein
MTERIVTIREDHYEIDYADLSTTHLSFDVVMDRIERYSIELAGRGVLDASYIETPVRVQRGTMEAYDTYCNLRERLCRLVEETGERAVAELNPQLVGLEGCEVEVTETNMHWGPTRPRRFIVAVSDGSIPSHLEVALDGKCTRRALGDGEYRTVNRIRKAR